MSLNVVESIFNSKNFSIMSVVYDDVPPSIELKYPDIDIQGKVVGDI